MTRRKPKITEFYEWIAYNDDDAEMDPEVIEDQISVVMVADLFNVPAAHIARKVVQLRRKRDRAEARS